MLNIVIGKVGQESAAARYASITAAPDFSIEAEKPYAEVGSCVTEDIQLTSGLTAPIRFSYGWARIRPSPLKTWRRRGHCWISFKTIRG